MPISYINQSNKDGIKIYEVDITKHGLGLGWENHVLIPKHKIMTDLF